MQLKKVLIIALFLVVNVYGQEIQKSAAQSKAIGLELLPDDYVVGSKRYALVIGINDYENERITDLKVSENDARAFYELVTNPDIGGIDSADATLLLGEKASKIQISMALEKLSQVPSDSTVFIFFSGHGGRKGSDAYWFSQDSNPHLPDSTGIPQATLNNLINKIPSKRVVVIVDCCYALATISGTKAGGEVDLTDVLKSYGGDGRACIFASGKGEEAIEASDLGYSVFTYCLLNGLRGDADLNSDGVIVLTELISYIDTHVVEEARIRGGLQKPHVNVQVAQQSRFALTVNSGRLLERLLVEKERKKQRQQFLKQLKEHFLKGRLPEAVYAECRVILEKSDYQLTPIMRDKEKEIISALTGEMDIANLERALSAIDSMARYRFEAPVPSGSTETSISAKPRAGNTNALCFSNPPNATMTLSGKTFTLSNDLQIDLEKGTHYFQLDIPGEKNVIYGKLTVHIVNEQTTPIVYGKKSVLFKEAHIKEVLKGGYARYAIEQKFDQDVKTVVSYVLGLRSFR